MAVAKEISYVEIRPGLFEPAPTKSQRRAAKRAAEAQKKRRKERWEMVGGILLTIFVVGSFATIVFVGIFADAIWPMPK